MISISEVFHKRTDALSFRRRYERKFPPKLYGTRLFVRKDRFTREWEVSGRRFMHG